METIAPQHSTPQGSTRSRAQAIRDKVVIRLALNETGPAIEAILKANGIELPGAQWDKVYPHWLIATVDDDVVGCCQLLFSKPIGYVEFFFVKPDLPFKMRVIALRKLGIQATNSLYHFGCQYIGGMIDDSRRGKLIAILEKMNFHEIMSGTVFLKRLA